MSIKYVLLGFLAWKPLTGYELKKMITASPILYWSGSNNQIYQTLVKLHKEGLVTRQVEHQDDNPPRKIYAITAQGQTMLTEWVAETPPLPDLKHPLLIQLMWSESLADAELQAMLVDYEAGLQVEVLMLRERQTRGEFAPDRSAREAYLWSAVRANWLAFYESQLAWVQELQRELAVKGHTNERVHDL